MKRTVDVSILVPRSSNEVWHILRGFCDPWHPAIDSMQSEEGGSVRVFTAGGENTLYKERLTWFSDSEREMRYSHIQGIKGAKRYDASVRVQPETDGACRVIWQAEIEADAPRCSEIATGTEAIFRMGIDALANAACTATKGSVPPEPNAIAQTLPGPPKRAILTTQNSDGPLILFLHGIGGAKENWQDQLHALGTFGKAVALDLRGYGASDLGADQSTIEDYCEDIDAVRAAFPGKPLILCGLSYGAWIATSYAVRHPGNLQGLVLAGGCTGMSEASVDARRAFLESRETPLAQGQTPADIAPTIVDVIEGPQASAAARADLLASMSAIPTKTYRDALRCFTNPPEQFDFSSLNMPVLMMTGSHDRLAPPAEIRGVAERIWRGTDNNSVRFEEIAGAGHVCNLEQPEAFNSALVEFISQVMR